MKDISKELMEMWERYDGDVRQILEDYSRLDYFYALSDIRESLLEWYPFRPDGTLLQVGADYGALTGLLSHKADQVTVLDENADQLEFCRKRYVGAGNIRLVQGSLMGYQGEHPEEKFDYIVMAGTLQPEYEAQIAAAKALLKPDGELITAVCNSLGMKYWAGVPKDEHSFSRKAITRLLTGDEKKEQELEWYYPMPDYKVPMTIYSQGYLPVKGDLTNTITAYDYPKYLQLDVGASFDMVCEDGQFENFANSFLTIWRSHGSN